MCSPRVPGDQLPPTNALESNQAKFLQKKKIQLSGKFSLASSGEKLLLRFNSLLSMNAGFPLIKGNLLHSLLSSNLGDLVD